MLDRFCSFAFDFPYQCETGLALDHADDGLLVILANDGVSFPVANAASRLNDRRALVDGLAIGNDAAPIRLAITLLALLLATKILPQCPAHRLVGVDPLVNRLGADRRVVADLLGAPLLIKPILRKLPCLRIDSSSIDCSSVLGKLMRLPGPITPSTTVPGQFSANRRWASFQHVGNLALRMSCFLQGVNLVSFFSGEVCVVHLLQFRLAGQKSIDATASHPPDLQLLKIALHP